MGAKTAFTSGQPKNHPEMAIMLQNNVYMPYRGDLDDETKGEHADFIHVRSVKSWSLRIRFGTLPIQNYSPIYGVI